MSTAPPETSEVEVRELLRKQEASEILRKRQQGHGRPIITVSHMGFRFVAVGQRLAYSRNWRFFTDFLLYNMKHVMGADWGKDASKSTPDHPIFRWLGRLQDAHQKAGKGNPIPVTGYVSALNRFCYALYLIEHNDKPPKSLIKRLRRPNDFDPACYEAIVASAFALAGAHIDGAEDVKGNQPKPEFFATFDTEQRYAVEAKRKHKWNAGFDPDDDAFAAKLRSWLRDKLYSASKKQLTNPVYWFELGIGEKLSGDDARRLQNLIGDAVLEAESLTVKGQPPQPAYVVVTNNADLADDDADGNILFALFQGFRMEDFREEFLELESAMERHDRHRPIRRVLECMEEVQQVPTSFDGVPDELLDASGNSIDIPQVGDRIAYPQQDGTEGTGQIEEMTAMGREAYVIVADDKTSARVLVKMPLTVREAKAAKVLGNAIFGKPEGPHENITDPLRFYDRMLEIYHDYPHESLLIQLGNHPKKEEFSKLSRDDLVVRVAREITKSMHSLSSKDKGDRNSDASQSAS